MRQIVFDAPGGPAAMRVDTAPVPVPALGEVLIEVHFAGVNRPDVLQRQGLYPAPPGASPVLGLEVCGTVVRAAPDVQWPREGERVCALLNGGGYAEFAVASAELCLPVPGPLSEAQAAGLPEVAFTVWHNLFERGRLTPGETVLVHGGTSGIGSFAIQLAATLGCQVLTTAGSREKCEAALAFGAHAAINHREQDFVDACRQLTEGRGVDVVLDMVGGDYMQRNLRVAAMDGRIVNIAFLRGSREHLDLMPLMLKRLTWTGSTLRAQSPQAKAAIAAELLRKVWPLLEEGRLAPHVHAVHPFERVRDAHAQMEAGEHIGKLILDLR